MSDTTLREALHDAALTGLGPVNDVQLANLADRARGRDQEPAASRGGGHRRWVVGVGALAVSVLLVAGVALAQRPVEVTPASGPGSLPDQIFPTREHILSMEQAPIGRVSMVFATASLTGDAPSAWIAVGADTDEYRWVAPASVAGVPGWWSNKPTVVGVSPDGRYIAVGYSGDDGSLFDVEVVDAATGSRIEVGLGNYAQLGGEIETLSWSPSGTRLVVECAVIVERLGDSGRRWEQRMFMVDGLTDGDAGVRTSAVQGVRPKGGDQLVGWSGGSPVVVTNTGRGVVSSVDGIMRFEGNLKTVGGTVTQHVGIVDQLPGQVNAYSLAPDGDLFVGLDDPTPAASGDGRPWTLSAHETSSGRLKWFTEKIPEEFAEIVGWSSDRSAGDTPVLWTAAVVEDQTLVQLVSFPPDGPANGVPLLDLSGIGEDEWVQGAALAADVLASGEVRAAQPPNQSWYDPRTAGPSMRDHFADWVDRPAGQGLALVLLVVGGLVVVARRRRRITT